MKTFNQYVDASLDFIYQGSKRFPAIIRWSHTEIIKFISRNNMDVTAKEGVNDSLA